jgi:hypothetical protein
MNCQIIAWLLAIFLGIARACRLRRCDSRRRARPVGFGPGGNLPRVCGRFAPPQIEAFDETDQIDHKGLETSNAEGFRG